MIYNHIRMTRELFIHIYIFYIVHFTTVGIQ